MCSSKGLPMADRLSKSISMVQKKWAYFISTLIFKFILEKLSL